MPQTSETYDQENERVDAESTSNGDAEMQAILDNLREQIDTTLQAYVASLEDFAQSMQDFLATSRETSAVNTSIYEEQQLEAQRLDQLELEVQKTTTSSLFF